MVGANEETVFARVKPMLETLAGKIVHIGGAGDGHRMKLINNFISLGYAALYAEALACRAKVGISPERFDSVIRGGRMDCGFYQTFMRWTLEGDPSGAQVLDRQRLQGPALSRLDGRCGRRRQPMG